MSIPELRIRQDYGFHRLEARWPLMIGGIDVAAERGAIGHSDGDVLLHAIVDALLDAIKAGATSGGAIPTPIGATRG